MLQEQHLYNVSHIEWSTYVQHCILIHLHQIPQRSNALVQVLKLPCLYRIILKIYTTNIISINILRRPHLWSLAQFYTLTQFKWQLCISLFYHFWPYFQKLYVHLSQDWSSDSHFEVLNASKSWILKAWPLVSFWCVKTQFGKLALK